jgi:hypothetical protein
LKTDQPSLLPSQFDFIKRRLTTTWPLFFLTIVLSAWNWPADRFPEKARWWEVLITQSLLLQSWVPVQGYVIKNVLPSSLPRWRSLIHTIIRCSTRVRPGS